MRCRYCKALNPVDHHYCGQCGKALGSQPGDIRDPLQQLDHKGDEIIRQKLVKMEDQAKIIEARALEQLMERALKWGKLQFALLFVALSILGMALGLLGYRSYSNFEALILQEQQKIADSTIQTKELLDSLQSSANIALEQAAELSGQMGEKQRVFTELEQKLSKINIEDVLSEAETIRQEAVEDRESIRQLQNSFFTVTIQIQAAGRHDQNQLQQLLQALSSAGFIMTRRSLLETAVDHTEVIYYNQNAYGKAQQLRTLLQKQGIIAQARAVDLGENDPRALLIKLTGDVNPGSG
jgi:hypothetical protein